jgi:DNA replication protein DnaC
MLNEPTIDKLKALRLDGMCTAWLEQQNTAANAALGFDERFAMLVDAEWTHRDNKRMTRSLKEAKLRFNQACIEAIDYPAKRELDKATIRQLASCRWVKEHQAILITGMTGTGKSFLACALAHQACRKGYRAFYRRAPRLFDELKLARADGTYQRVLGRIARVDVLVVDSCEAFAYVESSSRLAAILDLGAVALHITRLRRLASVPLVAPTMEVANAYRDLSAGPRPICRAARTGALS